MNYLKVLVDQENTLFILLFWEGEVWKRLDKALFFRKLKPLFFVTSLEEAERVFLGIEEKVAKSFAVNSLTKKAQLSSELVKKMSDKGISQEVIFTVIAFCEKIGALEDRQILENRIQKEFRKGHGLLYAKAKWQRSEGEDPFDWNSLENRSLEKESALQLVRKKKDKKDLFRFLLGKGFRSDVIKEVLNSEIK